MVECKSLSKVSSLVALAFRFNRYMVECKYLLYPIKDKYDYVLIDTWWNVNNVYIFVQHFAKKVLIDTWWNVNFENGNC